MDIQKNLRGKDKLLILHEYKVKGAVEEGVDEISETEVEDEEIGDSSHSLVPCHYDVDIIYSKTIQPDNNPQHSTVAQHRRDDHQGEGDVPEVHQGHLHGVAVKLGRTGNCSLEQLMMVRNMSSGVPVRQKGGVEADE